MPNSQTELELSTEGIISPLPFSVLHTKGYIIRDIAKQSDNKMLLSARISFCFAKVFSLHIDIDLYLKDKEEYTVLCENLFTLITSLYFHCLLTHALLLPFRRTALCPCKSPRKNLQSFFTEKHKRSYTK